MTKYPHFIKEGMKPLVFSERSNDVMYTAWTSKTDNIQLVQTSLVRPSTRQIKLDTAEKISESASGTTKKEINYILSFTHTFKFDDDRVYFAFMKPYSYCRLQRFLFSCEASLLKENKNIPLSNHWGNKEDTHWINSDIKIETKEVLYKKAQMCLSLGGVPVDFITITASSLKSQCIPESKRKYVIITARVHASETVGSYKAQGIIKFLLGKDPVASALRENYIFLIAPMLNPDGVILGNNRCSLGGYDLNRCWGCPKRSLQPTIFQLKAILSELYTTKEKQILVYCDLHGHSQLLNSFIYACHTLSTSALTNWTKVRMLPRIFSQKCHLLNYQQCSFKVEPEKVIFVFLFVF